MSAIEADTDQKQGNPLQFLVLVLTYRIRNDCISINITT